MTKHKTGTREEWLAARLELLKAEKALTQQSDKLARQRRALPWVRIDKKYRFETDEGIASLADLFGGRSQLLVYHFMFGPEFSAGCPTCTTIADSFNGYVPYLANHGVTLCAVSQAPLAKLQAYKRRNGWSFPWASSIGSDFKYDFQEGYAKDRHLAADVQPEVAAGDSEWAVAWAARVGTDWATYRREMAGISEFALEGGDVYSTYSAYERGLDPFSAMHSLVTSVQIAET